MTDNGNYLNEPRPRLCHLRRWPDFVGYGFNLHCEKLKPGQYIGKVDPDSPAESAGLRENDRIVEVNFVPIGNENHKQVVSRIKEGVTRNNTKYPEEVILLVLDPDADAFYKSKSVVVRSTDPNVEKLESEPRGVGENGNSSPPSSNKSVGKPDSPIVGETSPRTKPGETNRDFKRVTDFTGPTVTHTKTSGSPPTSRTSQPDPADERVPFYAHPSPPSSGQLKRKEYTSSGPGDIKSSTKAPQKDFYANNVVSTTGMDVPRSNPPPHSSTANGGDESALDLKMSAAEYREILKARNARKRDPRQEQQMSMREKHDLIDRL